MKNENKKIFYFFEIYTWQIEKDYVKFTTSGADDFILEMEKDCEDFKEAILTYIEFEIIFDKIQNGVNKEYFYKLGFSRF